MMILPIPLAAIHHCISQTVSQPIFGNHLKFPIPLHITFSNCGQASTVCVHQVQAIITDIEGTTTSMSFAKDVLFPYSKKHMSEYLSQHVHEPLVAAIISDIRATIKVPDADLEMIIKTLTTWIDEDKKISSLKTLQGLIWEEGYKNGDFEGHLYEDAFKQLYKWKNQGIPLFVYSSGSVHAQKLLFSHTSFGDITPLLSQYFDTLIGPKTESSSYIHIAQHIGIQPQYILFLSDSVKELAAAQASGMKTILVVRDEVSDSSSQYPTVNSFEHISIENPK